MKAIGVSSILLILAVGALLVLVCRRPEDKTESEGIRISNHAVTVVTSTEPGQLTRDVFFRQKAELDDVEMVALEAAFKEKLEPAIEKWCKAYAGRLPFTREMFSLDHFHSMIGRGTSYRLYTFIINGVTLSVEDVRGAVRVAYLNAPESKKLMQLPQGAPPDPSMPVTREEVATMLKADSGHDFPPADIRMIPTAFSSAMNGGVQVAVGGDPINIASWKFTLVFGPDGKLNYYCRGPE